MTGATKTTRRRGETDDTPAPPRRSFFARQTSPEVEAATGDGVATTAGHGALTSDQQGSHHPPTARAGARLTRLLLAKASFETVFVVALLTVFSYTHFNPRVRGSIDTADARSVSGWVVDESEPSARVEVQLFIDGHFAAQRRADRPRPDVTAAGLSRDDSHGFAFETPKLPPGEYEARVYALHPVGTRERASLQQIDETVRFRVAADERSINVPVNWWEFLEKR